MHRIATLISIGILALSAAIPFAASASVSRCPTITSTLARGMTDVSTGGQITQLQEFLTSYFTLSDNIIVGSFGPKTARYVSQFQAQNGIEQVGFVGHLTRTSILKTCNQSPVSTTPVGASATTSATSVPGTTQSNSVCNVQTGAGCPLPAISFTASPYSGSAPLAVQFGARINDANPYAIDFGDGTIGTFGPNVSGVFDHLAWHTYYSPGTYDVILKDSTGRVLGNTPVTVTGTPQPPPSTSVRLSGTSTVTVTGSVPPALVIVGPYDTAVEGNANIYGSGNGYRELITLGQTYRIRQSGTISRVRLYAAPSLDGLTGFYVKVYRKVGSTYNLVGTSNNLVDSLVPGGIATIDLRAPISGVQEGDYIGYRMETSNDRFFFFARTGLAAVGTYYEDTMIPGNAFDWESQIVAPGVAVPIEVYMQAPQAVFIGDSIITGYPANQGFLSSSSGRTDLASTVESQFRDITSYSYQNMGIGGQTSSEIAARFQNDVINLKPRLIIAEGGVNDIYLGTISKETFLSNWTSMLSAAQANGIRIVVLKILPWGNGTNAQMQTRDDWNAALTSLASRYSNAIVVDTSSYVGQNRPSGDAGNVWDIKPAYNADGVHFTAAGYRQIAQAIADALK